jgi:fructose-1,6-bisphosphatase/inositol monophosphatase family enzyme
MVIADGDFTDVELRAVADLQRQVSHRGTRSCSVDYLELAGGLVDMVWYRRTLPWDHAPGAYIIRRLGGRALQWSGRDYDVTIGDGGMVASVEPEHVRAHGAVIRALGAARSSTPGVLERRFDGRG